MKAEMINLYDMSKQVIDVHNIYKEDAEWFGDHGIAVSISEMNGRFLLIAGDPKNDLDVDYLCEPGDSAEEAFHKLRKKAAASLGIQEDD